MDLMTKAESNVYIISDGGVYNYEGTFGVVVSDASNPLVKNYGKMYSLDFDESSYRSELYAMLAGVLTLQATSDEYGELSGDNITVHLISNNKALVRKINNRLKNKRKTNQHRDSDVDLNWSYARDQQPTIKEYSNKDCIRKKASRTTQVKIRTISR
jgi:hypothetical protein